MSASILKLDKFVSAIIRSLLLISGIILFLQGWRLDPVLQFGQFLLFLLILYMILKDIVLERIERRR
ncbi:Ycf66 family protein [Coleofasciculus sp. FACHB-T130]|uniref:Ycf66 family protein n=1 Tax=Cyanophyceae TaxID=3028117 RepID=UPI0018EFF02A